MEITPCCALVILSGTRGSRGLGNGEKLLQEQKAINKQDRGQHRVGKACGVSQSLVNCLNDHKSARHEKRKCLEDYH